MPLPDYLASRKSNQMTTLRESHVIKEELGARGKLRCPNSVYTARVLMKKDVAIVLIFDSPVYTFYYCVTSSLPSLFSGIYRFTDLQVGLAIVPNGAGYTVASSVYGELMNLNLKRVAQAVNITIDRKRDDEIRGLPLGKAQIQIT